mmetsp:Transcript_90408/g.161069  ORF Transcript_90408/g.161069 Transcript_90408/m.161069 type:complete len:318 (+) Transcript_90408:1-954(+)
MNASLKSSGCMPWVQTELRARTRLSELTRPLQSLSEFSVDFAEPLGLGACSAVFAGRHLETTCGVAIKAMARAFPTERGALSIDAGIQNETLAFQRLLEAQGLDHPHLVRLVGAFQGKAAEAFSRGFKLYEIGGEEIMHYFVMELLEGGSLQDHLDQHGAMLEWQARHVTREVCIGLAHLHELGIVHRDLKPGNVLFDGKIDEVPHAKIIDFSHAGLAPDGAKLLSGELGTRGYTAPEVLSERPYGAKCDVFSLGCTAHALLSGGRVPRRQLRVGMVNQLSTEVSDQALDFMKSLLVMDADQRPSAAEVLTHPWLQF